MRTQPRTDLAAAEAAADFKTIADFRKDNSEGIKAVGRSHPCYMSEAGTLRRWKVAVDSTKIKARTEAAQYSPGKLRELLAEIDRN